MKLGEFSISLAVKNIDSSLNFYGALGFKCIDGGHINNDFPDSEAMKWCILQNGSIKIGLFQGMFNNNILTFNPTSVLGIQKHLKKENISLIKEVSESDKSIVLIDPDGNQIMFEKI